MSTITTATEAKHRASFKCTCSGLCGVNKNHGEIRRDFFDKFDDGQIQVRTIDRKWRSIGKLVSGPNRSKIKY